jgi:hypothetical protein
MRRRNILRKGAGTIALTMVPTIASASGDQNVSGVTYDTLTHKTGKNSSGKVERTNGTITSGFINVPGHHMALDDLNIVSEDPNRTIYKNVFDDPKYKKRDSSLVLKLYDWDDQLSGYVSRTSNEYGKRGFLMVGSEGPSNSYLRSIFTPDQTWTSADRTFNLPKRGVPSDTGIARRNQFDQGGE